VTDDAFNRPGSVDDLSDLGALTMPSLDPLFWHSERLEAPSKWSVHVPFGHWIVCALRPRLLVELGTQTGVSYSAFCRAVARLGLNTQCYGVEFKAADSGTDKSWEKVVEEFRRFHDESYSAFSILGRQEYDNAHDQFLDNTVDLLHFTAPSNGKELERSFENWLPKLSERSTVLVHKTNERCDSDAWRVWGWLCGKYPHFEFLHGGGLGVLAVGTDVPKIVGDLCSLTDPPRIARVRSRFSAAGDRWERAFQERVFAGVLDQRTAAFALEADHLKQEARIWKSRATEIQRAREQIVLRLDGARKDLYAANLQADRADQALHAEQELFARENELLTRERERFAQAIASAQGQTETARGELELLIRERDRLAQAVSDFELQAQYLLRRSMIEKLFFRANGQPIKPLRRLLFHNSGEPRSFFRILVLHRNGEPRKAFLYWLKSKRGKAQAIAIEAVPAHVNDMSDAAPDGCS
jgi:hypothetical protein